MIVQRGSPRRAAAQPRACTSLSDADRDAVLVPDLQCRAVRPTQMTAFELMVVLSGGTLVQEWHGLSRRAQFIATVYAAVAGGYM